MLQCFCNNCTRWKQTNLRLNVDSKVVPECCLFYTRNNFTLLTILWFPSSLIIFRSPRFTLTYSSHMHVSSHTSPLIYNRLGFKRYEESFRKIILSNLNSFIISVQSNPLTKFFSCLLLWNSLGSLPDPSKWSFIYCFGTYKGSWNFLSIFFDVKKWLLNSAEFCGQSYRNKLSFFCFGLLSHTWYQLLVSVSPLLGRRVLLVSSAFPFPFWFRRKCCKILIQLVQLIYTTEVMLYQKYRTQLRGRCRT